LLGVFAFFARFIRDGYECWKQGIESVFFMFQRPESHA
jgi:hypothetical protein